MSEIPEDVRESARQAMLEVGWSAPSMIEGCARAIMAERARCVEAIEYVRKNIRVRPKDRKRFDLHDINQTFRDACTIVKEKITGEDAEKWIETDRAEA